ncbi:hypothetical protein VTK26DRAFT_4343 [Humicola hyalothermophila]
MLAPFGKLGGAGASVGVAPVAAGAAAPHHGDLQRTSRPDRQPPMSQPSRLHPLIPFASRRSDNRRASSFTEPSDDLSSSVFTPSPLSPMSPASMFGRGGTGTVRTSRPQEEPPDLRIIAPTDGHISRANSFRSFSSSISAGSAVSAALSPGQMAWPMPPGTPPAIRHPDGPQYVSFQRSGEVVKINIPPRGRRPGD